MLDKGKLEPIKQAAGRNDWSAAGELYVDLLERAVTLTEKFRVGKLGPFIRHHDAEKVAALVDELGSA